jgi:hypothetical protein
MLARSSRGRVWIDEHTMERARPVSQELRLGMSRRRLSAGAYGEGGAMHSDHHGRHAGGQEGSRARSIKPSSRVVRALSHSRSAYTAYTAYTAYVDLGMSMRWRRNRKTEWQRVVLHHFVAFPPTSNSHFPYFHGIVQDHPPNSRGQANRQSQLIVVSPCLRRSST